MLAAGRSQGGVLQLVRAGWGCESQKNMTDIILYNAPQSTCSQRVRMVLHAKDVAFEEHKLDLLRGDQLQPDYLKLNPNGVVPTLVDEGRIIIDSSVIMEYLDEVFCDIEKLVPTEPVARASMRSLMRFFDEVPAAAIRIPTYNLAFLPRFQAMSEDQFRAMAESKPLRKEFLLRMGRSGFPDTEMQSAMARLSQTVERMAAQIEVSGGPFLLGTPMTLADIAVMPTVVRLEDLGLTRLWDKHRSLATWLREVQAHPAYAKTYYFGSLLTEQFPHLRADVGAT